MPLEQVELSWYLLAQRVNILLAWALLFDLLLGALARDLCWSSSYLVMSHALLE